MLTTFIEIENKYFFGSGVTFGSGVINNDFLLYVFLPNQRREIGSIWKVFSIDKTMEDKNKNYYVNQGEFFIFNTYKYSQLLGTQILYLDELGFLAHYCTIRKYLSDHPCGKFFSNYYNYNSLTNNFPKMTGFTLTQIRHFQRWYSKKTYNAAEQKIIAKWML